MDLHALTIDELRKLNDEVHTELLHRNRTMKHSFGIDSEVCFTSRKTGVEVHGKLIKINRTRSLVEVIGHYGEKRIYSVPFSMLKKFDKQPIGVV